MHRTSNGARFAAMLAVLGLLPGLSSLGCGAPGASEPSESTGSIGLALQTGGVRLNSVDYALVGPGAFAKNGTINVANSTQISTVIGGIPAGLGYTITLTATDGGNPGTTCVGSASFNVSPHTTTSVQVQLRCRVPTKTGSVLVNGSINVCPNIDSLSVEPAETTVGHAISLGAAGSDADQGPNALTFTWSASNGPVVGSDSATATFACAQPGPVTLTLTLSDGDCVDTASAQVTCSAATSTCGDGKVDPGEACDDGNVQSGDGCSATCELDDNASTPGDDRAGFVACGSMSCGPGLGCCRDSVGCAASLSDCESPFDFQTCDGPEDCPAGTQCWVASHIIDCEVSTPFFDVFCHANADCVEGATDNACVNGECLGDPASARGG